MIPFVLDASVALSIIFEDEFSSYSDAVADILKRGRAVVPIVWPLEIANAILTAVRRGRIPGADAPLLIDTMNRLPIDIDRGITPEFLTQATLTVGLAHRLSAYDASYLELAMRRGLPLATQAERLRRAADVAGIDILQP
jgi:predicted nucleic acid-binding protein